jgi:EAL and modified HD-GYP domain-containing signal transduction protein
MNLTDRDACESTTAISPSVFVGRQPIYTADARTYAYELLFRSNENNRADFADGETATAQLLLNTFAEIGLERVVGNLPAFINLPEEFILNGHCFALPKERVVLEVLEDVRPTAEILSALTKLRDAGYTIALDDFVHSPELMPLVELADIIKVDLPAIASADLPRHVALLQKYDVRLLAEKVETREEFEYCRELDFDYFQGYFFCRPTIISGKQIPANRVTMMRLISQLQKPSVSLPEITEVIQTEPALAYKLLRYVNSATNSLDHKVESVRHAVTLAGISRIKTLACLSALSEVGEGKPPELIQTILVRAKMAELLAIDLRHSNTESYFLTGLFSGLDALLDLPMNEALERVPVSNEVAQALTSRAGELGMVLNCVLEYERGNWEQVSCSSISNESIRDAYLQAIQWADTSIADM